MTIDCFLDFPYPEWFYSWVLLHHQSASSAQAAAIPAEPAASSGPLGALSAAAIEARLAADASAQRQQAQGDVALVESMLAAAAQAAEAAGQPLDEAGALDVMRAAAAIIVRRQQQQEAAEQAAGAASAEAARQADRDCAEQWQLDPAAAAMAAAELEARGGLAPPQLVGVHSQPYGFEGQQREHRWVLAGFEERNRQRGRQQFDLFPRNPAPAAEEQARQQRRQQQQEEDDEEGAEQRIELEQQRRYQLLPAPAILLHPSWGMQELPQQPVGQRQPGLEGSGEGSSSVKKKKKRRQQGGPGGAAAASAAAAGPAGSGSGGAGEVERQPQAQQEEEELFPFTYDWDQQQRRRDAGQLLRQLLGKNFDKAMGQASAQSCMLLMPLLLPCCFCSR